MTAGLKDRAWAQLGTSGSGNHFVEFGELTVLDEAGWARARRVPRAAQPHRQPRHRRADRAALQPPGARAPSASCRRNCRSWRGSICRREAGQEYWAAMNLMGQYAAANHALIHAHIARALGRGGDARRREPPQLRVARTARLPDGSEREVIVHRKGATPAGAGVLGIIPGSMGTPGYVVRGKGEAASLNSASHGAGRRMSRTKAKEKFTWDDSAAVPARARRHAAVGGPRRSADGLQGHRRGDGRAERPRRAARAVRSRGW